MTQDEIIEMAKESDLGFLLGDSWLMHHEIEYFAKLVADKEREAWERKFARLQSLMDLRETQPNKPCCLAEREACAKEADKRLYDFTMLTSNPPQNGSAWGIASAIRARGQA
jgi:hypothetical protein